MRKLPACSFFFAQIDIWKVFMHHLVNATKKALDDKNWYAALTLALSLPDICAQLETPSKYSKKPYKRWYSEYVLHAFQFKAGGDVHPYLTPGDCYALRCAFLHQGEFEIQEQDAREVLSRVTFRAPHPQDSSHLISNGKVLHLKIDMFCNAVCDGVDTWMKKIQTDSEIQQRIYRLGRIVQL